MCTEIVKLSNQRCCIFPVGRGERLERNGPFSTLVYVSSMFGTLTLTIDEEYAFISHVRCFILRVFFFFVVHRWRVTSAGRGSLSESASMGIASTMPGDEDSGFVYMIARVIGKKEERR